MVTAVERSVAAGAAGSMHGFPAALTSFVGRAPVIAEVAGQQLSDAELQELIPDQAAAIILDGVRSGAWRILAGEEAKMLDEQVRASPEAPFNYENYAEMYGPLIAQAEASGRSE